MLRLPNLSTRLYESIAKQMVETWGISGLHGSATHQFSFVPISGNNVGAPYIVDQS